MLLSRRIISKESSRFNRSLLSTQATTTILNRLGLSTTEENNGVYNGQWKGNGSTYASINPSTGQVLAEVREASKADVEETLARSREAFEVWRKVPAPKRGEILRLIRAALSERLDDLGALVTLEMGKIKSEGKGEVQEFVDICDFAVGLSRTIGGTVLPSERSKHFITEVSNPLGVVGVISAFNFPIAVYGWNLALAMITGNASIWKPSPTTPLCAIATTRIISQVLEANNLPGAISSLLCGGAQAGSSLVHDKRVDLLSFTGSEERGRQVGMTVAGRFGKSILELGGNNGCIVLKDANMDLALRTILFSALGTAGQRCTSTRRLFLHSSIVDSFLPSLVAGYESTTTRMGCPTLDSTLVGPVHGKISVENFEKTMKEVEEQGGKVLVGGKRVEMTGNEKGGHWVQPTIVYFEDSTKCAVMKKETFAPILFVSKFETLEEAILLNNSVNQGLSSTLFTQSMSSAFQWIGPEGSDSGISNVNVSNSGAEIGAPFGGNKSTGWGREAGGESWKMYCRMSSCTLNWSNEVMMAQGVKFEA